MSLAFPETYLRSWLNDLSTAQGENNGSEVTVLPGIETREITNITTDTTSLSLTRTPNNFFPVTVFVNGLLYEPTEDYTITSTTISFVNTLHNGDIVQIIYWY